MDETDLEYVEKLKVSLQSNFSSLLCIAAEQQAMIGKLLGVLVENGLMNLGQLTQITDIDATEDGISPIYKKLHDRYCSYYMWHLQDYVPIQEKEQTKDEKGIKDRE